MYDVAIIGCGIIGASVAYELSKYDIKTVVLEKDNDVANAATKANSAIIHAGYDPKSNTLMAKHNLRGSELTKQLCIDLNVPYKQCGSLVIALNEDEVLSIKELYDRGVTNGVKDLFLISGEEALKLEPNLNKDVKMALFSKSAAIINPWEYCLALAETAVRNGVSLLLENEVKNIHNYNTYYEITTNKNIIKSKYIVNAAGIFSEEIHTMVAPKSFSIIPTKGEYYLLDKSEGNRVSHIIFQCPSDRGKGILVAPTVHGNLIVGPNSEIMDDKEDISTTSQGLKYVSEMAKKSVPSINFKESIRNFSGIRANSDKDDFIINEPIKGFIDLAGIKSPGLSAASSIGITAIEMLNITGLVLKKKENFINTRKKIRIKELLPDQINKLIQQKPSYGKIICRCETISEGEITDTLYTPIPPKTLDGIKRRTNAGMGRCQSGFCGPKITEILCKYLDIKPTQLLKDKKGSFIILDETKGQK